MTESEQGQHRQMLLAGAALLVGPILVAILLSVADAPIDPKFTAPVFTALMIGGAATLGKAFRFKREVRRR